MIPLQTQEFRIAGDDIKGIKDRMTEETCKTNLNPQLIFNQQSFTGHTAKSFVGNWTRDGFWISKYRLQLFNLRPDIIAKFTFFDLHDYSTVSIRYSIGFSSAFVGLAYLNLISFLLAFGGLISFPMGLAIMTGLYGTLSVIELRHIKKVILKKIFNLIEPETVD
jgi:hypothetical protein